MKCLLHSKQSLVLVMAWNWIGAKPSPESLMTAISDTVSLDLNKSKILAFMSSLDHIGNILQTFSMFFPDYSI